MEHNVMALDTNVEDPIVQIKESELKSMKRLGKINFWMLVGVSAAFVFNVWAHSNDPAPSAKRMTAIEDSVEFLANDAHQSKLAVDQLAKVVDADLNMTARIVNLTNEHRDAIIELQRGDMQQSKSIVTLAEHQVELLQRVRNVE
ncbi:hypothetical protein [Aeromonas dhakensis]|uniref:hypothetical protein n=1 Tax=Aeromonas dhakensis TaxID=196024 RepID=UPI0012FE7A6E|nr:hypothetical protein [Aeromonas dhakensis]